MRKREEEERKQKKKKQKKIKERKELNTHKDGLLNFLRYLTASKSEEWYSRLIPPILRFWFTDSWVDPAGEGYFGGEEAGVRNRGALVIISKKESNWRNDNALWRVSNGLIGGTPPKPSIADEHKIKLVSVSRMPKESKDWDHCILCKRAMKRRKKEEEETHQQQQKRAEVPCPWDLARWKIHW